MKVNKRLFEVVLGSILLLNAAWGGLVFMVFLQFNVFEWLIVNICAPSETIAAFGILAKYRGIALFSVPFLLRFGGWGLYLFPWNAMMMQAQVNHILMVFSALYILYSAYKIKAYKKAGVLVALGAVIVGYLDMQLFPSFFGNPSAPVAKMMAEMGF